MKETLQTDVFLDKTDAILQRFFWYMTGSFYHFFNIMVSMSFFHTIRSSDLVALVIDQSIQISLEIGPKIRCLLYHSESYVLKYHQSLMLLLRKACCIYF